MARPSILASLDRAQVSDHSRIETRKREDVLPPISVYRWWARRTDAVNGAVVDAAAQKLARGQPLLVLDPFAGGGVIPLSALRRGHQVYAKDLDPWAAKGLKAMLALPNEAELRAGRDSLIKAAGSLAERAYGTRLSTGAPAQITQTFRVMRSTCSACGHDHRLFPFALVSLRRRRDREPNGDRAILACKRGHLFDGSAKGGQVCPHCADRVDPASTYLPERRVTCPECGATESLEQRCRTGVPRWEVVLVERSDGKQRELDQPTPAELAQASAALWTPRRRLEAILDTPETRVLSRHGFDTWSDLYPARQRYVTERLLRLCRSVTDDAELREALTMAVLGTVEMAGHMSRWDRYYLKAFEMMASHRFNFTTLTVEPNVIGKGRVGRGTLNLRLESFLRASRWMMAEGIRTNHSEATVACGNSERLDLGSETVDLVLTDPPYHDDVSYAALSLPFRSWARLATRRRERTAVGDTTSAARPTHERYRQILTGIFVELRRVLKSDGRLIFSYANREPIAWIALFRALRSAGFHPLAYTILQSENELDPWRQKGRACSLDLLLELSPQPLADPSHVERTDAQIGSSEESFLLAVGEGFLSSAGASEDWEAAFAERLRAHSFLAVAGTIQHDAYPLAAE